MIGWGGESAKTHVERAHRLADGADEMAQDAVNRVEELEDRVTSLEAETEQPHKPASTRPGMDQIDQINSDFGPLAKLIDAMANHITNTYSDDELNALGSKGELRRYIKITGAAVAVALSDIAADVRAQAEKEKGKVQFGRG